MTSGRPSSTAGRESNPSLALPAESGLEPGLLLFLRLPAGWMQVEAARVIGTFYCQAALDDPDLVQRLTVIIHECVENAVKYATPGSTSDLVLGIRRERERIVVSVCSHPDPSHLPSLRAELARIGSVDPRRAFAEAVARAAAEPHAAARLGLARVRHEGQAELSLEEHDGGMICLTARGSP